MISFTTGKNVKIDCRYDVWDISSGSMPASPTSQYSKGEKSIKDRSCRFPHFMKSTGAPFYYILVLTEYYKTDKTGFLRIKL